MLSCSADEVLLLDMERADPNDEIPRKENGRKILLRLTGRLRSASEAVGETASLFMVAVATATCWRYKIPPASSSMPGRRASRARPPREGFLKPNRPVIFFQVSFLERGLMPGLMPPVSLVGGVVGGVMGSRPGLDGLPESSVRLSPLAVELLLACGDILLPFPSPVVMRLDVRDGRAWWRVGDDEVADIGSPVEAGDDPRRERLERDRGALDSSALFCISVSESEFLPNGAVTAEYSDTLLRNGTRTDSSIRS